MGHPLSMTGRSRRRMARFMDYAIPWGVALFLVLVVFDEKNSADPTLVTLLGLAIALVQSVALRWRRRLAGRRASAAHLAGRPGRADRPGGDELLHDQRRGHGLHDGPGGRRLG